MTSWRVSACIEEEPLPVVVEDSVEDEDTAIALCKHICEDGFFYTESEDKKVYYPPFMIDKVIMERECL